MTKYKDWVVVYTINYTGLSEFKVDKPILLQIKNHTWKYHFHQHDRKKYNAKVLASFDSPKECHNFIETYKLF